MLLQCLIIFLLSIIEPIINVEFNGGRVLINEVPVHIVFYGSEWTKFRSETANILRFLEYLPETTWFKYLSNYKDSEGRNATTKFQIAEFYVESEPPNTLLTPASIMTYWTSQFQNGLSTHGMNDIYIMIGDPKVEMCTTSWCQGNQCSFHGYSGGINKYHFPFIYIPNPRKASRCSLRMSQTPHGQFTDAILLNLATAMVDTIVNPEGDGWSDPQSTCSDLFEPIRTLPDNAQFNAVAGGKPYLLPLVYDVKNEACSDEFFYTDAFSLIYGTKFNDSDWPPKSTKTVFVDPDTLVYYYYENVVDTTPVAAMPTMVYLLPLNFFFFLFLLLCARFSYVFALDYQDDLLGEEIKAALLIGGLEEKHSKHAHATRYKRRSDKHKHRKRESQSSSDQEDQTRTRNKKKSTGKPRRTAELLSSDEDKPLRNNGSSANLIAGHGNRNSVRNSMYDSDNRSKEKRRGSKESAAKSHHKKSSSNKERKSERRTQSVNRDVRKKESRRSVLTDEEKGKTNDDYEVVIGERGTNGASSRDNYGSDHNFGTDSHAESDVNIYVATPPLQLGTSRNSQLVPSYMSSSQEQLP